LFVRKATVSRFPATGELADIVSQMDETSSNRVAQFYYNGKVVSEQPIGQFLWFILFDAIHHRGQLSAYLRPMGATVPAIYGPSGDSRSMQPEDFLPFRDSPDCGLEADRQGAQPFSSTRSSTHYGQTVN
jgi:hypothetical protein